MVNNILSKYKDRLINIRKNNKALNLNKITRKYFDLLEIFELEKITCEDKEIAFKLEKICEDIINNIIDKKEMALIKIETFKNTPTETNLKRRAIEEAIFKKLRKVDQEADLIKRTSGIHAEFIGYPFIEGKINDLTIKAPLFLFPVDLVADRKKQEIKMIPEKDIDIQINKTLLFAIEKYVGRSIDENAQEEMLNIISDKKLSLNERIKKIVEILSKYIDISNELPDLVVERFSDKKYEKNVFRIRNYMVLGIFIQFSSAIAKDYDKLMELDDLGLIDYLLGGNDSEDFKEMNIDRISEMEKYFVSDIDPSQEESILSFVKSNLKGIVIHGPPGTGKSQTIVNLISQFVKDRKKVLMVCQKKTALDVVKNRLEAVGIKNAILIEDYERDRNAALKLMKMIIENLRYDIYDESKLKKINKEIDEKIKELNEIKEILSKKWECGLSLSELYRRNKNKDDIIKDDTLAKVLLSLDYETLEDSLKELEEFIEYTKYDQNIMKIRKDWKDLSYSDKEKIEESLKQLIQLNETIEQFKILNEDKHNLLSKTYGHIEDIQRLIELLNKIKPEYQIPENKISYFERQLKMLDNLKIPDNSQIFYYELKQNENYLITYDNFLKQSFISKFISKLFNSEIKNSERIVKELENKSNMEFKKLYEVYKILKSLEDIFDIPEKLTKDIVEELKEKKLNEILIWKTYYLLKSKFKLPELLNNETEILKILKELKEFGELYPRYQQTLETLSNYFDNIETLDDNQLTEILRYMSEFDDIKYYDMQKNELQKEHWKLTLLDYLGKYSKDKILNTYYYCWITKIESKPDVFKVIKKIDNYENIRKRLMELYSQKFQETREYLKSILNDVQISGEARRKIPYEADKKRRRKPLKEILENYLEDVLNIVPIWLTTPDVVSAIFPLKKGLFDVVIFDEASQMPVEYALPSLYRAKRFVVAGDEKQLPPTDFFKATFDEDEEEEDIEELNVKSLLDLCKGRCPTVLLSYHYRSKYEEIINFSNYAFYNGKIAVAPNKDKGKPFEFIKVNGIWKNRKNYEEARAVVEKVYELLKENPEKSIGIITFNAEQRDLIYEMFDKKAMENDEFRELYEKSLNLKKDGEDVGLFVRNIENVQGDERDIIIFSTGYAKDKDGKLRYNFGPLNRAGGENRLNVAITRAKEKVIIITSIEPEELKVENTKNEGPKLLKKYLQYAKAIANNDYATAEIILKSLCNVDKVKELKFDSPFEEDVYNELTKRGYIVDTQVGCSRYRIDLAIKHPKEDRYILGIECDGATYHSSRSAKERDLYRQKFLEMKGWKIIRIWSRNWWKDKEKEIERIENEIKRILSNNA
ncbi:hypothetical protein JH146_0994 [Methanocaldococcus bathoardescens]|uniref:RAP domain-containing protein n=1 Tax=Methanocaldococcus bathoardescens TaxID=1301915 RepID=A0A076LG25_9EURY|nr:AAA domain-containing protein [Methanocaldococcus bathoardescens]AIJ05837.1 hypothetical protein JH146_0994 [Methanocaldococcus bathoardescens]